MRGRPFFIAIPKFRMSSICCFRKILYLLTKKLRRTEYFSYLCKDNGLGRHVFIKEPSSSINKKIIIRNRHIKNFDAKSGLLPCPTHFTKYMTENISCTFSTLGYKITRILTEASPFYKIFILRY